MLFESELSHFPLKGRRAAFYCLLQAWPFPASSACLPCGPSLEWQLQPQSIWCSSEAGLLLRFSEIMTSITTSNSNPHKEAVFEPEREAFLKWVINF